MGNCYICQEEARTPPSVLFIKITFSRNTLAWRKSRYMTPVHEECLSLHSDDRLRVEYDIDDWIKFAGKEWEPVVCISSDLDFHFVLPRRHSSPHPILPLSKFKELPQKLSDTYLWKCASITYMV